MKWTTEPPKEPGWYWIPDPAAVFRAHCAFPGMSIRTYIATQCLQGLLANSDEIQKMSRVASNSETLLLWDLMAQSAVAQADALLEALKAQ